MTNPKLSAFLILSAGYGAAADPVDPNFPNWELRLAPIVGHFNHIKDAVIIVTARNTTGKPHSWAVPDGPNEVWCHWFDVFHEGKQLKPWPDDDFGFGSARVPPGHQFSKLVSVSELHKAVIPDEGEGAYYVIMHHGGVSARASAHTTFEVVAKAEKPMPRWDTVEYYLDGKPGLDAAGKRTELWKRMLASPTDPKWLGLLRIMPKELFDVEGFFRLMATTKDLGIKREAAAALRRIDGNAALADRVEGIIAEQTGDEVCKGLLHQAAVRFHRK